VAAERDRRRAEWEKEVRNLQESFQERHQAMQASHAQRMREAALRYAALTGLRARLLASRQTSRELVTSWRNGLIEAKVREAAVLEERAGQRERSEAMAVEAARLAEKETLATARRARMRHRALHTVLHEGFRSVSGPLVSQWRLQAIGHARCKAVGDATAALVTATKQEAALSVQEAQSTSREAVTEASGRARATILAVALRFADLASETSASASTVAGTPM